MDGYILLRGNDRMQNITIKGGESLSSAISLCQFQIVVNELIELFFKMFHTAFKIAV